MEHSTVPVKTGTIPFAYNGETFETYYKLFGDLAARTRDPLLVLHGGPGLVHDYLVPFCDLTAHASIPVLLYDQLGSGLSSHVKGKENDWWTIDLFAAQLQSVISFFDIGASFNLAGHSWGGVLASEFAVRYQPAGLKHLILSNSLADFGLWTESTRQLMQSFPQDVQEGLQLGMSDPKKYHAALLVFHKRHGLMGDVFPEPYIYTLEQALGEKGDMTVLYAP